MIKTQCPRCLQIFEVPESLVGQIEKCPYCKQDGIVSRPALKTTHRAIRAPNRGPAKKWITCPFCGSPTPKRQHGCAAAILAVLFFPIGLLVFLTSPGPTTCQHCGEKFLA